MTTQKKKATPKITMPVDKQETASAFLAELGLSKADSDAVIKYVNNKFAAKARAANREAERIEYEKKFSSLPNIILERCQSSCTHRPCNSLTIKGTNIEICSNWFNILSKAYPTILTTGVNAATVWKYLSTHGYYSSYPPSQVVTFIKYHMTEEQRKSFLKIFKINVGY